MIVIEIEKKNIDFKDADGQNVRPFEKNSSMRELKTWIEVQP